MVNKRTGALKYIGIAHFNNAIRVNRTYRGLYGFQNPREFALTWCQEANLSLKMRSFREVIFRYVC